MVDIVEEKSFVVDGLVLVDKNGEVWRTFSAEWWQLGKWLVWWAESGTKKWVFIRKEKMTYRLRAVRLAKSVVYLGQ